MVVLFNAFVRFIIQKLKNKHTFLKKCTNWEIWGISYFDRMRGEKNQIFPTIEACEFDKGDCCLLDSESKRYCTECLCKEDEKIRPEDSKYTGENCGRRLGERDTKISFTNGPSVSPTKVNTKWGSLQ